MAATNVDPIDDAAKRIEMLRRGGCTVALDGAGRVIVCGAGDVLTAPVLAMVRVRRAQLVAALRAEQGSVSARRRA